VILPSGTKMILVMKPFIGNQMSHTFASYKISNDNKDVQH